MEALGKGTVFAQGYCCIFREGERMLRKKSLAASRSVISTNFFIQVSGGKWHWQLRKWHVSPLPRAQATLSSTDSLFPRADIKACRSRADTGHATVCAIKTSIKKEIAGGKQEREIGKESQRVRGAEQGEKLGESNLVI